MTRVHSDHGDHKHPPTWFMPRISVVWTPCFVEAQVDVNDAILDGVYSWIHNSYTISETITPMGYADRLPHNFVRVTHPL